MTALLEVTSLDLYYADAQALADVSLKFPKARLPHRRRQRPNKSSADPPPSRYRTTARGGLFLPTRISIPAWIRTRLQSRIGQVAEGPPALSYFDRNGEFWPRVPRWPRARVKMKQTMESVFGALPRRAKKQLAGTLSGGGRPRADHVRRALARPCADYCSATASCLCVCWNQKGLTMLLIGQKRRSLTEDFTARYVLRKRPIVMSGSGKELAQQ